MTNLPYILIELLDELVYGVTEAAWPSIQASLKINYTQIGVLMTVPGIVSIVLEPFIGVLGDVWKRRLMILGGGIVFSLALLLTGSSTGFTLLLISFCLFYPASGAFVSLSQASLMDTDPGRHDQNMARWTFAGSLGVTLGPLVLVGFAAIGFGWRGVFLVLAMLSGLVVLYASRRMTFPVKDHPPIPRLSDIFAGFKTVFKSLGRKEVLRWLILLEFSDLMLDVLLGFLALYFHDELGITATQAGAAVLVWLVAGLAGDLLLIPLLEKMDGLVTLRWSVVLELLLFPAFLLMPSVAGKLILAGLLGFFNSGWYAILQGRLYSALPGQSASVMVLGNLTGLAGSLLPLGIGIAADAYGLDVAMWFLLAGPIALIIGIPWRKGSRGGRQQA